MAERFLKAYYMVLTSPFMNVASATSYIAMTAVARMARDVPVVDQGSGLERGKLWRDKI